MCSSVLQDPPKLSYVESLIFLGRARFVFHNPKGCFFSTPSSPLCSLFTRMKRRGLGYFFFSSSPLPPPFYFFLSSLFSRYVIALQTGQDASVLEMPKLFKSFAPSKPRAVPLPKNAEKYLRIEHSRLVLCPQEPKCSKFLIAINQIYFPTTFLDTGIEIII